MHYMANHPDKYTSDEKHNYLLKLINCLMKTCKIKIDIQGKENIPESDGLYVCANHQEKFDSLAIWFSFPKKLGVILKDDVTYKPFIREVCNLVKTKKLKKDLHKIVNLYAEITADLKKGYNYLIFPEGEYSENPKDVEEFHPGSFKSPQRAKCPIVPVALIDSSNIFDKGFKSTRPIQVHYLPAIMPSEYDGMNTSQIAHLVRAKIQERVSQFQI
ncbi:MAG: 1-acyl-sn-glycerol-3-phosphate acyltransferase [Treponema sp.]|nr:1-acyl-sn-glycerol-3-phosphate acyltransferase [Treponema sp.]